MTEERGLTDAEIESRMDGDRLLGRVDNDLLLTERHGLALDDVIAFMWTNVYDVDCHDDDDGGEGSAG